MPRTRTYHAELRDELGDPFVVTIIAASRAAAIDELRQAYPESTIRDVETDAEVRAAYRRNYRYHADHYDDPEY